MVEYFRAIKRPFQNTTTLIIGIIIGLIPIVGFLTLGFSLRAAKATLNGDNKLPKWNGWGDIIIKTIASIVISFVYSIPALLALILGLGSLILIMFTNPTAFLASLAGAGVMSAILVAIILFIIAFLFSPIGIIHYLKTGKFFKAFALGEITKKVFTGKYIVAWLFSIAYFLVLAVVMAILSIVPIVGALVGTGIIYFLGNVTSVTVYAEAYKEAK